MIIRPMEVRDLEQVYDIEKDTFTLPWTYQDFEAVVNGSDKYYLNLYLVAEEDGIILGYCGLWGVSGEGQINNVAVKKEYRDQHIGLFLLNELIKQGNEYKLHVFTLEVRVSNYAAIKLYQNLGFQEVGIRKDFYELPKEDAIIMWLG